MKTVDRFLLDKKVYLTHGGKQSLAIRASKLAGPKNIGFIQRVPGYTIRVYPIWALLDALEGVPDKYKRSK